MMMKPMMELFGPQLAAPDCILLINVAHWLIIVSYMPLQLFPVAMGNMDVGALFGSFNVKVKKSDQARKCAEFEKNTYIQAFIHQ